MSYKIFYENPKGIELIDFISAIDNQRALRGYRTFYVIKAKMESQPIYKIGVTTSGNDSFYSRAMGYINHYGVSQSSKSKCVGVTLYYLIGVKYNENVEAKNSFVFKLELKLKNKLREFTDPTRGDERFKMSLSSLMAHVYEALPKIEEKETKVKRSPRLIKIKV